MEDSLDSSMSLFILEIGLKTNSRRLSRGIIGLAKPCCRLLAFRLEKIYLACLESCLCRDNNVPDLWSQQGILADEYRQRGTTVCMVFPVTFH